MYDKSDPFVIPLVNGHQQTVVHSVQKCSQSSGSAFKWTNIHVFIRSFIHTVLTFGDTNAEMMAGNVTQKSTELCYFSYSHLPS
jgi:hypothetical protein